MVGFLFGLWIVRREESGRPRKPTPEFAALCACACWLSGLSVEGDFAVEKGFSLNYFSFFVAPLPPCSSYFALFISFLPLVYPTVFLFRCYDVAGRTAGQAGEFFTLPSPPLLSPPPHYSLFSTAMFIHSSDGVFHLVLTVCLFPPPPLSVFLPRIPTCNVACFLRAARVSATYSCAAPSRHTPIFHILALFLFSSDGVLSFAIVTPDSLANHL